METNLIFIVVGITAIFVMWSVSHKIMNSMKQSSIDAIDKLTRDFTSYMKISNLEQIETLSDDIFTEFVLDFVKDIKRHPELYTSTDSIIFKGVAHNDSTVRLWIYGGIGNVHFFNHSSDSEEFKAECKSKNARLTHYDKLLLYKVYLLHKEDQTNHINKLFNPKYSIR